MTSDFSRRFASALRGVMKERGIDQKDVAERIGKSEGYVSGRLNKGAPDSDMADAVADLAHLDPVEMLAELARRMRSA